MARAVARLPAHAAHARLPHLLPAYGPRRGAVALFTGCTGELFDAEALAAAPALLNAAGFDVHVPPTQGCCGALHAHAGDHDRAHACATQNIAAFSHDVDAVVAIASGCAVTLAEYEERFGQRLAAPVFEVTAFLAAHLPAATGFSPLEKRAAIHEPCTQRRIPKAAGAARALLARIPGLELSDLPGNERCCGSAGAHMLLQPEIADALVEPKAAAAQACGAELLVTTNIGCALHLRAQFLTTEPAPEVVHPIVVAARQLLRPGR